MISASLKIPTVRTYAIVRSTHLFHATEIATVLATTLRLLAKSTEAVLASRFDAVTPRGGDDLEATEDMARC
jgi:hypothetical protein